MYGNNKNKTEAGGYGMRPWTIWDDIEGWFVRMLSKVVPSRVKDYIFWEKVSHAADLLGLEEIGEVQIKDII